MTLPAAPLEAGGDKLLHLVYDAGGGTNAAAVFRGVRIRTVNSESVGYLGIATHADGDTFTSLDPVVAVAGLDGSTVRKVSVDPTGRLIPRPQAVYDNGGVNTFGHPYLVAGATLNSERVGWLGVGTHLDGVAGFTTPQAVAVIGSYDGANVRHAVGDVTGRLRTSEDYVLGGHGHAAVATPGTAVALRSSTVIRRVTVKADSTNAAQMFVGLTGVTTDKNATTGGYELAPGEDIDLKVSNLSLVFVNSAATGGVSFLYWT